MFWEIIMKKIITLAFGSALVVLTVASAASATERKGVRRHTQHPVVTTTSDPRNAFDYYPGWGRDRVPLYGVPPGLIYGGAISAPAGH
jgi:hypothetical protein